MHISISNRLLILAIVPVVVIAVVMLATFHSQTRSMLERQVAQVEKNVGDVKRAELKHIMDMAFSSIKHIYESGGAFEEALPILRNQNYGENGYVFAYSAEGERLLLGSSDKGLGENYWDLQDKQGNYLIRELLKTSQSGDGYFTYWFPKPNETEASPKTSYSIYLERWGLFMGTGFYFDDLDQVINQLEQAGEENMQATLATTAAVGLMALLLAFGGGYYLSRTIRKPIEEVSRSVDGLAEGEADLTTRLEVSDRFELGKLADRFNVFIITLRELIQEIKAISSDVMGQSRVISEQTHKMEELISEQDNETDQVATAVTEMTAAATEISRNASEAAAAANNSDEIAIKVRQNVTSAAEEVNALANDIVESTERVTELGRGVTEISSVVDVIRNIAEQTNLLALNAAIEAARAGEQGRGFAVVADEVRGLASKTQQSTEEIASMIDRLGNLAQGAVNAMAQSKERGMATLTRANDAVDSIGEIVQSISVINEMNNQIATASEEQSCVCEDITQRLVQIADKANESTARGSEVNQSAQSMLGASKNLSHLVERFKTG